VFDKYAAIAVHCKAGKGRTGLMVIAHLLFSEYDFADKDNYPENAIEFYNVTRTMNKKALTIASQIRYVNCFYQFLEQEIGKPYFLNSLKSYNRIMTNF
jgi:protein-tyrosine phosphatase